MTTPRAAGLALLLALALTGCDMMQRISEGAYGNAVADGTVAELRGHGVPMDRPPECTVRADSEAVVRVECTGRTAAGIPVVVTGGADQADTEHPRESYTITVGGRELVRESCLGVSCDDSP